MIDASLRLRRAIHIGNLPLVHRILKAHPSLLHNSDQTRSGLSNTNLHLACQLDDLPIVELLLSLGHESKNISLNNLHQTPVMIAASMGHVEILNKLCEMGEAVAGIARRDIRGRDAVMLASEKGQDTCVEILLTFAPPIPRTFSAIHPDLSQQAIANLGRQQALLMNQDFEGNTALHFALANGHIKLAAVLLNWGADPEIRNAWSWMAVSYSTCSDYEMQFKKMVADRDRNIRVGKESRAAFAESHVEMEGGPGLGIEFREKMASSGLMGVRIVSQPD